MEQDSKFKGGDATEEFNATVKSALQYVAASANPDFIRAMRAADQGKTGAEIASEGADPSIVEAMKRNDKGLSPLDIAAIGALHLTAGGLTGVTPLDLARRYESTEMIAVLKEALGYVNRTPLDFAEDTGNKKLIGVVKVSGANYGPGF